MINVVRIPITDRNIQCMLYLPSRVNTSRLINPNDVSRWIDQLSLQRSMMRVVSDNWRVNDHHPVNQGITVEPLSDENCHYQFKLHAITRTDKLLVCMHTTLINNVLKPELLALFEGDNEALANYMADLQIPYTSEPIEVVHPDQEHLIPFAHTKSELEDTLKVTKRKLHTSLVNNLNSSDLTANLSYDLDEEYNIILIEGADKNKITVVSETWISNNNLALRLMTSHRQVERVQMGPTLLKEYLDYMTALAKLASYNERVRCNL